MLKRKTPSLLVRKALAKETPLTLLAYASAAQQTDRFADKEQGIVRLRFGFFGEIGGLLAAVKKVNRDTLVETETEVAGEEIGDALWYLFSVAHAMNISPEQLGFAAMTALRHRFSEGSQQSNNGISFSHLDAIVAMHDQALEARRIELLSELARASGELIASKVDAQMQLAAPSQVEQLGELLSLLVIVCFSFSIRLEDVARDNLVKIHGRWPGKDRAYTARFDDEFPLHEQIPRILPIKFEERGNPSSGHVVQSLNHVFIGDRLKDNSNEPDDYRFHDVFHLAYLAHLGWSPVIRGLLKHKRKSVPAVDENEDGARAMIIEEGIATWIFNHAKKRNFYIDIEEGKLDYSLLKQVHSMVSGYEVDECPLWQWERAILRGFDMFRDLQKYRGGIVHVDMFEHTLKFEQLQPPPHESYRIC